MPPSVIKKRRRAGQGLAEDVKENQSKLVGFKRSIVRPIVDPRLNPKDQKAVVETGEDADHLKALASFDWNHSLGPCSEISRSQRLGRAKKFRLPIEVNVEKCIYDQLKDVSGDLSVSTVDVLMRHCDC